MVEFCTPPQKRWFASHMSVMPDIGILKEQGDRTQRQRNSTPRRSNQSLHRRLHVSRLLRLTQTCRLGIDDMSENARRSGWQFSPEYAYMTQHAEGILELFDWTGLEVEFHPITLDRFKGVTERCSVYFRRIRRAEITEKAKVRKNNGSSKE